MREIKFRGWKKNGKKMWSWDDLLDSPDWEMPSYFDEAVVQAEGISKFVLMQYTGLSDKNGKEIYEGDIINGEYGIGEVIFSEMTGSYKYKFALDSDDLWLYAKTSEVVGNIYEHSHLLKRVF